MKSRREIALQIISYQRGSLVAESNKLTGCEACAKTLRGIALENVTKKVESGELIDAGLQDVRAEMQRIAGPSLCLQESRDSTQSETTMTKQTEVTLDRLRNIKDPSDHLIEALLSAGLSCPQQIANAINGLLADKSFVKKIPKAARPQLITATEVAARIKLAAFD